MNKSVFKTVGRQYNPKYLDYCFSFKISYENGKNVMLPLCLLCKSTFSNNSMIATYIKTHYNNHVLNNQEIPSDQEKEVCVIYIF